MTSKNDFRITQILNFFGYIREKKKNKQQIQRDYSLTKATPQAYARRALEN
jgi:hypothetical protein